SLALNEGSHAAHAQQALLWPGRKGDSAHQQGDDRNSCRTPSGTSRTRKHRRNILNTMGPYRPPIGKRMLGLWREALKSPSFLIQLHFTEYSVALVAAFLCL